MRYPKLSDSDSDELIRKLAEELLEKNNVRQIVNVLSSLMTEKELRHVSVRLEIAKMLMQRVNQRYAAAFAGVGIATVTSVSKVINSGGYQWLLPKG